MRQRRDDRESSVKFLAPSDSTDSEDEEVYRYSQKEAATKKRCGRTEQQMTAVLIMCIIIIIILSAALVVLHLQYRHNTQVCTSPHCVKLSGDMISKMNLSVAPCDDFYEYACARFEHNPLIPPDKSKWGSFSVVNQRNSAILKKMFETDDNTLDGAESTAISKLKTVYTSCMDTGRRETTGKQSLLKHIQDFGNWSVLEDSPELSLSSWNVEDQLAKTLLMGVDTLLDVRVTVDDKNSSKQRIAFDQSGLTLPDYRSYTGNNTDKYRLAFVKFFSQIVVLLGGKNATDMAEKVWTFEKSLATAFEKPENRVDPEKIYHLITLDELQNDVLQNNVNVQKMLALMFGEDISLNEKVLVYALPYLQKLGEILKTSDKETLSNYMMWHVVNQVLGESGQAFSLAILDIQRVLYGIDSPSPLWERCVRKATACVGFAAGTLFTREHFSADDRKEVENILGNIQHVFEDIAPLIPWMDATTKAATLDKARAVSHKIGYPDFITSPTKLDAHYQKLHVDDDSFQNTLSVNTWAVRRNLNKRNKPTDRTEWDMVPTEVNAYYNPSANEIVFPAAILQNPFYDATFPMSLNYGAFGAVVGHELTHGFDNTGRKYDKMGNLNNWWTNASATSFAERAQCLIDQYSQYTVADQHLDGRTTLGENIADNGGAKIAYLAYDRWLSGAASTVKRLPGLDLGPKQTFFLSYAQIWCSYYTPEYAKQSIVTDVHSYPKYRVIGTLSNMPQFADAFHCPEGSRMNPKRKCDIW